MRKYAAAIGILVGCATGLAVGLPLSAPWMSGVLALTGLIIGYVISQGASASDEQSDPPHAERPASKRLRELEKLRDAAEISEAEYQQHRKRILDQV